MTREQEHVLKMLEDAHEKIQGLHIQATGENVGLVHDSLLEIQSAYAWVRCLKLPEPEQEEPNEDGREV